MKGLEIIGGTEVETIAIHLSLEQASDLIDRCLQSDIPDSPIFEKTLALLLEAVGAIESASFEAA